MACNRVFNFVIIQTVLFIIFPMSLYYQNTKHVPEIFRTSCRDVVYWYWTTRRIPTSCYVCSEIRASLVEQKQYNANQYWRGRGFHYDVSATFTMPDHASCDAKFPKSIYSDSVISGFSNTTRFSLFLLYAIHYLIDIVDSTIVLLS